MVQSVTSVNFYVHARQFVNKPGPCSTTNSESQYPIQYRQQLWTMIRFGRLHTVISRSLQYGSFWTPPSCKQTTPITGLCRQGSVVMTPSSTSPLCILVLAGGVPHDFAFVERGWNTSPKSVWVCLSVSLSSLCVCLFCLGWCGDLFTAHCPPSFALHVLSSVK